MNHSEFEDSYDDVQSVRGAVLQTPVSERPTSTRLFRAGRT